MYGIRKQINLEKKKRKVWIIAFRRKKTVSDSNQTNKQNPNSTKIKQLGFWNIYLTFNKTERIKMFSLFQVNTITLWQWQFN